MTSTDTRPTARITISGDQPYEAARDAALKAAGYEDPHPRFRARIKRVHTRGASERIFTVIVRTRT